MTGTPERPEEYRLIPAYDTDGNETGYYTREPDGISGMTVGALARFVGAAQAATITQLLDRIRDADQLTNTLPDSLKAFAGQELRLLTNDPQGRLIIPDEACYAIAEYYSFDARSYQGQELARDNYRMAGRAGMRVFIWSQTGYVPELLRESLRANTTAYIERLENIRDHDISDNLWSTFREGAEVLLLVEKEMGVPVDQMDLCDGSIGFHWGRYRENKAWAGEVGSYTHVFRDQRGEVYPKAYDLSELSYFRQWLRDTYIPFHLPKYLADKYGKLAARDIYDRIGGVTERVEEVTRIGRMTDTQRQLYDNYVQLRQRLLQAPIETEQLNLPDDE